MPHIQVKESGKLRQVMQTILTLGNALNQGTARGMSLYGVCVYILFGLNLVTVLGYNIYILMFQGQP